MRLRSPAGQIMLAGTTTFAIALASAQTPAAAPAKAASDQLEEIVVTGSRVIANGNDSPTPVTVIPVEEMMALQPTTVTEAVNLMPALQGSQNVTSRPGGGQRDGAGSYFNLRNMGNLRTLVLYDGMRLVPTINQNQADTNSQIVPQLLLKRVDVVTGGVSAVYGSDAVSGVVNFITDRDFNGFKAQVTQGVSTYGDDKIFDIGFATGTRFAGNRGHVEFSYQFHNDPGIVNRGKSDRTFFNRFQGAGGNGTTVPYFNFDNYYNSNTSFAGLSTNGVLSGLVFNPDGTVRAFNHGLIPSANGLVAFGSATAVPANVESGGDGAYNKAATLKASIGFNQSFGRLDFDFTDTLHGYAQIAYSNIHTYNNFQSPQIAGLRISYANPFLSSVQAPYAAQIATQAATASNQFSFSRFLLNEPRADQRTESSIIYAGLDGTVFGKYKWNVNIGRSKSQIKAGNLAGIDNGRLFAATDVVLNNGLPVCRAALTNANYANCVPLNLFGEGRASQAALDYLFQPTFSINRTRMEDFNASIVGSPFSSWAGPVNLALSANWYKQRWDTRSNAAPWEFADCNGIQTAFANTTTTRNCVQGTTARWFFNVMGPLDEVSLTVKEGAFESSVPLLADAAWTKALDFTGAVRFTNYSTSGSVTTWKAGLDWKLNDSIKFRGTRSKDIRAPNLFDLYSPVQRNPGFNVTDSLTNTQYTNLTNVQLSNSSLTPEKADTTTLGIVLTPSALPDFSFSSDYYHIKVKDVIFLVQGFQQATVNYCNSIKGAAALCSSVVRNNWTDTNPLTNPIQNFLSTQYNISTQDTWGVDTEIAYKFNIVGRPLRTRLLASYQPKLQYDFGPLGGGVRDIAGAYNGGTNRVAAAPKWKLTGIFTYEPTQNVAVTVLERWRSTLRATYDRAVLLKEPVLPSLAYTTLNVAYTKDTKFGNMNVFLNVNNLFNKFPTVYYIGGTGNQQGLPEGDDPIGRYYTLGLRVKL